MSAPKPTDIPRHLRIALANAQRAFERDDFAALATINMDLQGLVDAAMACRNRALAAAEARGRREERADVVAWILREEAESHKHANAAQDNGHEPSHQRHRASAQTSTYAAMEIARGSHVTVRHDAPKEPR